MLFATRCHQQFWIVTLCPLVQLFAGRIECQSRGPREHAGSDVAVMLLNAIPHHLFQFLLVGHNLLRICILPATESVEPLVYFSVPEFPWIILHTFQSYVAVFHLAWIRELLRQRQLGCKRADGRLYAVALSQETTCHSDKSIEGPAQLAVSQCIIELALLFQFLHRQFQSAFRTYIHQVLPILALHWRRVNLVPHSTIFSWHNNLLFLDHKGTYF